MVKLELLFWRIRFGPRDKILFLHLLNWLLLLLLLLSFSPFVLVKNAPKGQPGETAANGRKLTRMAEGGNPLGDSGGGGGGGNGDGLKV